MSVDWATTKSALPATVDACRMCLAINEGAGNEDTKTGTLEVSELDLGA